MEPRRTEQLPDRDHPRHLQRQDDPETGGYLVDKILDTAGAKGTGKWMSQLALDLGVPSTLVTEAVYARCLSAMKDARVRASKVLEGPDGASSTRRPQGVHRAGPPGAVRLEDLQLRPGLRADAGGRGRAQVAAELRRLIALLWRGGCIIRAVFLERIKEAFDADAEAGKPAAGTRTSQTAVQKGAAGVAERGDHGRRSWAFPRRRSLRRWPTTTATAAERLPANLLQAQRDYFGAHLQPDRQARRVPQRLAGKTAAAQGVKPPTRVL